MLFSRSKEARCLSSPAELFEEIERIEALLSNVSSQAEDPETELATVMRLSMQKKELEAYLRGLRYALGDRDPL